jgi:hypothetical protein
MDKGRWLDWQRLTATIAVMAIAVLIREKEERTGMMNKTSSQPY